MSVALWGMVRVCVLLGQAANLQPIPSLTALVEAHKLITDVYGRRIEAAKTPAQKAAVGQEILAVAEKERNHANRYAGFQVAKKLAVEAEDGKLGLAVVKRFASEFQPPLPREDWPQAAEKAWTDAESKKGSERLTVRLDAAECWLRAGKVAEAIKQQWQTRIDSLETGADVVLWAKKATLKGPQIAYHNELDLIYRWSDPSAYVEWQTFLAAGKYDVGLEYRADRHMAPSSVMGIVVATPSGSRSVYQDTFTLQRTGDEFAMYRTHKVLAVTASGEYVVRLGVINKASSKSRTTIINPRSIQLRKR